MPIKKYCDYYYQVKKTVSGKYSWVIYNKYGKGREALEYSIELHDTPYEAELEAKESISYHYN